MRVLLTGGGTGGHVYPALAIAEALIEQGHEVYYAGTKEGVEASVLSQTEIPFYTIKAASLPRRPNAELFRSLSTNFQGLQQAKALLRKIKPDLVFGTGGFVSGTIVWTAQRLGVPTIIHEQNASPGLTNRLLAKKADRICLTFEASATFFTNTKRCVWTGLPVRSALTELTQEKGLSFYKLQPEKITILVTGGSRGARSLNIATVAALPKLLEQNKVQVIFATGTRGYTSVVQGLKELGIDPYETEGLVLKDYLHHMPEAIAAADLVVGRAGATFLAEISMAGKTGVLIPYPYAAGDHQTANAQIYAKQKAATVIADNDLSAETLLKALSPYIDEEDKRILASKQSRSLARPHAIQDILHLMSELTTKDGERHG